MISSISIMGCGWLGLPLAKHLLEQGYLVKGSTTSNEKKGILLKAGITPFIITLNPQLSGEDIGTFFQSDLLIINIPPGIRSRNQTGAYHLSQIESLVNYSNRHGVGNIIFVSSTSVYPSQNKVVSEEDGIPEDHHVLLQCEKLLRQEFTGGLTLLRSSGLMGYDRVPGKYFAGKKDLQTGEIPVNFIHRDDVIGIISLIIEKGVWGETYNLVTPVHPTRREIYLRNADDFGFEPPEFSSFKSSKNDHKLVDGSKLIEETGYSFKYPNPLEFHYTHEE